MISRKNTTTSETSLKMNLKQNKHYCKSNRERKKEGDIEREEKDKGERWERKKKRIDREIKGL